VPDEDISTQSSFLLSTGKSVTSMAAFPSPTDEYCAAFEERDAPFLYFYTFRDRNLSGNAVSQEANSGTSPAQRQRTSTT